MKKNKLGIPVYNYYKDVSNNDVIRNNIRIIGHKYDKIIFIDRVIDYFYSGINLKIRKK